MGEINVNLVKLDECKKDFENLLQAHQSGVKNIKQFIDYQCGTVYTGMKRAFEDMVSMSDTMECVIENTINFIEKAREKMEKEDKNASRQFE